MSARYWFRKRTSLLDFGRPAKWQGWAALLVFIFLFALLMQMIGGWAFGGMQPLAQGVWLLAFLFILIGGFLSLCNRFSPPVE